MNNADLVVTADRVVDGALHQPVQSNAGIAVVGDRIVAVASASELDATFQPRQRLHFDGGSLLPGFIDAHCHLTQPGDGSPYEHGANSSVARRHKWATRNAQLHLRGGVTTLRDLGSHADLFDWRREDNGLLPRALLYGRPLTPVRGHMYLFGGEASGPNEVRIRADENLQMGSDGLKIVGSGGTTIGTKPHEASYSVEELAAASEVAHANGKVITAHALPLEAMRRALEADVDGIEHLGFLSSANESTFDVALARRMVDKGMTFGSTLGVNRSYISLAADGLTPDYELEGQRYRSKYYIDNARQLHEVGGRLVAASDAGWKFTPFGRFSEELMLLGQAGLNPMHVIAAATSISADYLKLGDVGRLAPGFSADFVVVNGDPNVDLSVVENIVSVGARGQVVPLGNAA